MIYKIDNYTDDEGRTVIKKSELHETKLETTGKITFIGNTLIPTKAGFIPFEFPFPETTNDIVEAFNTFEKVLEDFINKQIEASKSNLIIPQNSGKIII